MEKLYGLCHAIFYYQKASGVSFNDAALTIVRVLTKNQAKTILWFAKSLVVMLEAKVKS